MNIGIIVEGDADAAVYPELIRKLRNDVEIISVQPCGNDVKLMLGFVGWLKYFRYGVEHSVDKALVIRDSDCRDASGWEQRMKRTLDESRFVCTFPIHFHATKCELESWLLADVNAVNEVARQRGKRKRAQATSVDLETHRNAKELFRRVLSDAALPADAQVYREVAAAIDIERIRTRCPSFTRFAEKVMG